MTRRQKEIRRAMERQITAQEHRPGTSRWARTRTRLAAQRVRTRSALRAASRGGLLATLSGLVAISAIPGCLTFSMVRDAMILENRGVQVAAQVVDYRTAHRGTDTVTVRPLEPPYFETDLDGWPRGVGVGQHIDVVFDPHDPGLAVAVGAPQVDLGVLILAAFDLLGLVLLLFALLPAGELVRRGWARARGDRAPRIEHRTRSRRPRKHRASPLMGLEPGQVVFLLIAAPVGVALSGLLAANIAGDALALENSGVHARATVERSSWGAGGHWLDVRFSLPDGSQVRTSVAQWDRVSFEGDTLDVLYRPEAPRNIQLTGDPGWQTHARIAVGAFIVCAAGAAVAVPVGVADLVQRARAATADDPGAG